GRRREGGSYQVWLIPPAPEVPMLGDSPYPRRPARRVLAARTLVLFTTGRRVALAFRTTAWVREDGAGDETPCRERWPRRATRLTRGVTGSENSASVLSTSFWILRT